ncbi:Serine/threonine-protein kinase [Saitoella coloradoensis]
MSDIANAAKRLFSKTGSQSTVPKVAQHRPDSLVSEFHDEQHLNSGQTTPQPSLFDKRYPEMSHDDRASRNTVTSDNEGSVTSIESVPVGPPRGRLTLTIVQARNLKISNPNAIPYVVCTFEGNEFITREPVPENDDMARGVVIPKSRQSSFTSLTELNGGRPTMSRAGTSRPGSGMNTPSLSPNPHKNYQKASSPFWRHEAAFDVCGEHSVLDVSVYDKSDSELFLGHVRIHPILKHEHVSDEWYKLQVRDSKEGNENDDHVGGDIKISMVYENVEKRHYGPDDFEVLRLIGKGTFGQVYQVRKRDTQRIYAMKVLSKKVIVQKKEVAHTIGERNILVRTAMADSPFIVGLKFSFQTPTDLYLVTDYMSGGELFWHLQQEGKFSEARARFYIAELVLALEHLHDYDIVYRDLKPENILLDANGHIALCDFGLSKANLSADATTNTFCGTTEYLAPEVLLDDAGYTKLVDFWSLGVLVFEMCCGWSPFYAEDTQQMYKNIAFGKVRFPKDVLSQEGRNFVKGLLNRNPKNRLGATRDAAELKEHPFFDNIDWNAMLRKEVPPPFKPTLTSELDTSNFDPEFTNAPATVRPGNEITASTPLSPGMQEKFKGFTFVDENLDEDFGGRKKFQEDLMDEDALEGTGVTDDEDEDDDDTDTGHHDDRMEEDVFNFKV